MFNGCICYMFKNCYSWAFRNQTLQIYSACVHAFNLIDKKKQHHYFRET